MNTPDDIKREMEEEVEEFLAGEMAYHFQSCRSSYSDDDCTCKEVLNHFLSSLKNKLKPKEKV